MPLRRIQLGSWIILLAMVVGSGFWLEQAVTLAVVVGGVLANASFWLLQRDLTRLLHGELASVKTRFFVRYYVRLAVLALILYLLVSIARVNIPGLLAGLSVVFLGIAGVAVSGALKTLKIREAS